MRKKVVFALFAIMVIGLSLSSCKQKELCPAYGEAKTEQVTEDTV